jgi:hypothetical protein
VILHERVEKRPGARVPHLPLEGLDTIELKKCGTSSVTRRQPFATVLIDQQIQRRAKFIVQVLLDAVTPYDVAYDRSESCQHFAQLLTF